MKLIIELDDNNYCDKDDLADAVANGTPYNPTQTGDCISREALKKEFEKVYPLASNEMGGVVNKRIYDIIDNAPTVEITEEQAIDKLHETGWLIEHDKEMTTRPKGEWIEKVERRGCFAGDKTVYSYTCPFCGVKEFKKYPFCHCGADMRKGDEEWITI